MRLRTPVAPPPETARSLAATATTLTVHLCTVPGLITVGGYATDSRGRLLVPTSADCRVLAAVRAAGALSARAVATDVAPLPVRCRVRGRLELTGRLDVVAAEDAEPAWAQAAGTALEPGRVVLRLTPRLVRLHGCSGEGPVDVDPAAYAQARPDPLAAHEADVLSHLCSGHPEQVRALARLLPRRVVAGARRVVPLRLNRHALVLRVERDGGDIDVPVALACRHAEHPGEVLVALRALLDTAGVR